MWVVFALLAAFTAAIVVTLSKAGIREVDSSLAFAIQSVLILIVSWSVVAWQGNLSGVGRIGQRNWMYLCIAGVVTCLSSLCSFYALKIGDASKVSSLERVSLAFSVLFAVLFLKEKLNWQVIAGVLMMIAGAVLIALARKSS